MMWGKKNRKTLIEYISAGILIGVVFFIAIQLGGDNDYLDSISSGELIIISLLVIHLLYK